MQLQKRQRKIFGCGRKRRRRSRRRGRRRRKEPIEFVGTEFKVIQFLGFLIQFRTETGAKFRYQLKCLRSDWIHLMNPDESGTVTNQHDRPKQEESTESGASGVEFAIEFRNRRLVGGREGGREGILSPESTICFCGFRLILITKHPPTKKERKKERKKEEQQ